MTANAIEIRNLEKSFKCFKLGPIDLTVPKGAIYGLIGPNAAGKTTTIDLIMNMGRKDNGSIQVFDLDNDKNEAAIKARIGYVSPDLSFGAWKKVKRLIHFIRPYYPSWDQDYCVELMEKMNIGWNDKIGTMSFGSKVKLAVILALSHKPDLLLLDEPVIGVDAVSKKQIFTELLAAVQNEERTVLISSHGLTDIERFTDHIGMIKNGKMLLEGPTSDIVERFCMIDCIYDNGLLEQTNGVYPQEHSNNRWRALIDLQSDAQSRLKSMGAREISESPVTLEELFIALTLAKEA